MKRLLKKLFLIAFFLAIIIIPTKNVKAAEYTYNASDTKTGYHLEAVSSFPCYHSADKCYLVGVNNIGGGINPTPEQLAAGYFNEGVPGSFWTYQFSDFYGWGDERISHHAAYFTCDTRGVGDILSGGFKSALSEWGGYTYYSCSYSYCSYEKNYYFVGRDVLYTQEASGALGGGWSQRWEYNHTVTKYKWVPNSYTMTSNHYKYNPNTGSWENFATTTETASYGTTYIPPYSKTPTGYYNHHRDHDSGWTVTGDASFAVYYYPNSYTMTSNHYKYNPNTGSWEHFASTTESATYGTTYTPPYSKTPTGYHNYSRDHNSGWTVTNDASFAVKYYPNTYGQNIYYYTYNASGPYNSPTHTFNLLGNKTWNQAWYI